MHRAKYHYLKTEERAYDIQITKTNEEIKDSHDRIAVAKDEKIDAEEKLKNLAELMDELQKKKEVWPD